VLSQAAQTGVRPRLKQSLDLLHVLQIFSEMWELRGTTVGRVSNWSETLRYTDVLILR
jgi:hypothetical protein